MSWFPVRTKLIFCSSSEGVEPGTVWVCWCIWVVILYHLRSSLGGKSMGLLLPGRRWLVVRKKVWWPEGLSAIVFPCPRLWWAFVHVTACSLISCQECTQIQNSSFSYLSSATIIIAYHLPASMNLWVWVQGAVIHTKSYFNSYMTFLQNGFSLLAVSKQNTEAHNFILFIPWSV